MPTDHKQLPKTMPLRPPQRADDAEPMLIVVEGLEPGRRFPLRPDTTAIGRGTDNHVVLPSPAVSTEHGRIVLRDGQFWLEDLQSTNGLSVNGSPVKAGEPRVLTNGDAIRVSDHLLFFHRGSAQHVDLTSAISVDRQAAAKQADDLLEQLQRRDQQQSRAQ